jgi:hypothetical protein
MNANIRHMLDGNDRQPPISEAIIRASFEYFRSDVESMDLSPQRSCWAVYFARRHDYLGRSHRAQAGARAEGVVHTPGDIAKEQKVLRRRRVIRRED